MTPGPGTHTLDLLHPLLASGFPLLKPGQSINSPSYSRKKKKKKQASFCRYLPKQQVHGHAHMLKSTSLSQMPLSLGRLRTETHSCSELSWLPLGRLGGGESDVQIQDARQPMDFTTAVYDLCDLGPQLTSGLHFPIRRVGVFLHRLVQMGRESSCCCPCHASCGGPPFPHL